MDSPIRSMKFSTQNLDCEISSVDVTFATLVDGERELPLVLSYRELLALGNYIQKHRDQIEQLAQQFEVRCEEMSRVFIDLFAKKTQELLAEWKQQWEGMEYCPPFPDMFDEIVHSTLQQVQREWMNKIQHWYHEDEKSVYRFWYSFEAFAAQYREMLYEQYDLLTESELPLS